MRGRAGYVIAVTALVGGVGLAALIAFQQLRGVADGLQQVVVPGEHEITLTQAGAHTIFYEQRAVVEGRYFASDRQLHGLSLRLLSTPAGEEIAIGPSPARTRYAVADREGSSIATFTIPRPGTYRLSAWYPESAPDTTAVLAIGQGVERRLATTFGSLAAVLGGVVVSAVITIATFVRRRRGTTESRA